ncbi:hypothetical protein F511_26807 [Dorcoceras hygrometricum]|uniref:Uncharacterized protein n=1 Tax=Dorcoceras hygrometricum TaxID=472368 RepID=A0A2Z7C7D3_9LAMI|nr:hypothetical protein F511_26807 [Dorcoceras hygrometricum]
MFVVIVAQEVKGCEGERQYRTLISLLGSLATMRRVVNYHSSWARQWQLPRVVGDPDPPLRLGSGRTKNKGRETINTKNRIQNSTFIGRSKRIPCWHLCLAPTGITRTQLFSVDCGRYRQSGPRPEPRLLRQAALEALTNSARTDSPQKTRPETIFRRSGGGDGGGEDDVERGRRPKPQCKMTVLPLNSGKPRKSHFSKSSSRAQHIELSIRATIFQNPSAKRPFCPSTAANPGLTPVDF